MKVVVVGGGAIGMLQARSFAKEGCDVVIVDKGELGREASWAGGGIISPLYPWRYSDPVTALASRSQELYPDLVAELHQESGIDPEYSAHGLLMLQVDDKDKAMQWAAENRPWLEEITAHTLYELEPELGQGHERSLWMPSVGSVRNPRLLRALRAIMHEHPSIEVIENDGLTRFDERGVTLDSGKRVDAASVVFCSGAWTSSLLPNQHIKIEPVKGQMIVFDAPLGLVNRVVLSGGRYVIPRRDGKVVVGSTLEYCGFDKSTDDEARKSLYESALALYPALEQYPVIHQWAGLRPGSPNGVPSIGAIAGYENVFVNAGHFRNGLVLAPASVELLSDMVAKRASKIDANPYIPSP
jgi:glycine oxidase